MSTQAQGAGGGLGFLVNSETGHSEELQPNLRHAGSVKRVKVRATGDLRAYPHEVVNQLSFIHNTPNAKFTQQFTRHLGRSKGLTEMNPQNVVAEFYLTKRTTYDRSWP